MLLAYILFIGTFAHARGDYETFAFSEGWS